MCLYIPQLNATCRTIEKNWNRFLLLLFRSKQSNNTINRFHTQHIYQANKFQWMCIFVNCFVICLLVIKLSLLYITLIHIQTLKSMLKLKILLLTFLLLLLIFWTCILWIYQYYVSFVCKKTERNNKQLKQNVCGHNW